MMFSTKAEYGVRVMVAACSARQAEQTPTVVPLAEIAEHAACRSHTSSTSWRDCEGWPGRHPARLTGRLHARAGRARDHDGGGGRGARGLDRADRVHLRGRPTARSCARASRTPSTCAPRSCCGRGSALLDREHAARDHARRPAAGRRPRLHPTARAARPTRRARPTARHGAKEPMADLEIRDLHVRTEEREILRGRRPRRSAGARSTR